MVTPIKNNLLESSFASEDYTKAQLLFAHDDAQSGSGLGQILRTLGYQVEVVNVGPQMLRLLGQNSYDLMVADIHVGSLEAMDVMPRARQLCPELPIVVMTEKATLAGAIAAIKLQAVDYLLKPVSAEEIHVVIARTLQKRIAQNHRQHLLHVIDNALAELRQVELTPPAFKPVEVNATQILRVGHLTLDRDRRLVVLRDTQAQTVELTEGEAAILSDLMTHPDRVLSCRQLVRTVCDYDVDEHEAQGLVRPYIFRLRHKIEVTPNNPQIIRTVRGRGYLLAPFLMAMFSLCIEILSAAV